ncbi:hypothetical protein HUN08_10450 [Gordonia sp. X0973]|uniref:hypothetical protein n=1 Tax=Gordonia sp. X0973 TaxID=2742602 RepID=UPI000F531D84|nr:hypothetical protein [Gordonia sp. X0973]QKT07565.1 hypothetical protein HUN08_10450 [Gordonia sp. X0973]
MLAATTSPTARPTALCGRLLGSTAVALLALCLPACGSKDSGADTAPCAAESTTADATVRPIPLAQPTVELVSAGDGDRAVLRAAPDRGSAQHVRFSATTTVLSRLADAPADDKESSSRQDQAVNVELTARHHCTDDADVALRFDSFSAADPVVAGDLGKDSGSRGGLTVGAARVPISLRLWPNGGAPDNSRAIIENTLVTALQTTVALPDQPVGTGATWRSTRTLLGATTLRQTITATLRGRTGDAVDLDVSLDESPTGSDYTVPGTSQTLRIARYSSLGRGTLRIDLRRALPVGGKLDLRGARELIGADAAHPLVQQTRYQLSWTG